MSRRAKHTVRCDADGPASARRFVRDTMRTWGCDELIADAELLVSEAVTNSVEHSAHSHALVDLMASGRTIRVDVSDPGAAGDVAPRTPEPDRAGGFGLAIIESVAVRWGVEPSRSGKSVWFELEVLR